MVIGLTFVFVADVACLIATISMKCEYRKIRSSQVAGQECMDRT